jgi:hypothetical protein
MRPLVSVVIPAHNPGRYIEPCIRSLLRQTMPRDRFEVVFVDDGSTDGTGARLDRLAWEQPHIRVIHIPASGGPGRPRNVGLEAALGEYVQFLDADDELAPRALQRLFRMAHANGSDIVLGKFASETVFRRQDVFTRNRPATTFAELPGLVEASMGPTKLFRTAFLREHEIAFPEGWRQMEDQLFTLQAYLAARVISILGDEPCYFFNKREDEGHISAELVEPAAHAEHLREILDEVDGVSDPALRARLQARFYRLEVLGRLTGTRFLGADPAYQRDLFAALRALTRERFVGALPEGLGAFARIRSRLLLEGDLDDLVALGRRGEAFEIDARVARAAWTRGRLVIEYRVILSRGTDGRPLSLVERDGTFLLDPAIADDLVGPVDVTEELGGIRAQVSLVDRQTALEWIVPSTATLSVRPGADPDDEVRIPGLVGSIDIDPQRVGPGEQPLDDGTWDVQLRWTGLGIVASGLLRFSRRSRTAGRPPVEPALLGRPVRWTVPRLDPDGSIRLAISGPERAPARLDEQGRVLLRDGRSLAVALPVATAGAGSVAAGIVRLAGDGGTYELPAAFTASLDGLVVSVDRLDAGGQLPRGRYALTAHLGSPAAPGLPIGTGHVGDGGRMTVIGLARESSVSRLARWTAWTAERAARGAYRRLPPPAKHPIRSVYGRLRA